jgi:hypothetical protein
VANAIPVHSKQQKQVEQKADQQPDEQKKAEPQLTDTPKKGVPYKMPSGSICVDH